MSRFPNVFRPLRIKSVTIPNRLVFPPVVTGYSEADGSIGKRQKAFYRPIAKAGPGLVIVGATSVSPEGVLARRCSRIDDDKYVKGLSELFTVIKSEGAVAGIQLAHAGRQTNTVRTEGLPIVAPSAVPCPVNKGAPRELTIPEIKKIEADFVEATRRALRAGADVIEYHAAHGYLINQFLSPFSNKRTDEYGGSLENRARFALDIMKAARRAVGDGPVLGFRLSAVEFVDGGLTLEESKKISQWMAASGADFIDVSAGVAAADRELRSKEMQKGTYAELASEIRKSVDVPVICVGAVFTLEKAESLLAAGKADMAAMCRAFIADPALMRKTLEGKGDTIVDCIDCRRCYESIFDDTANGMECTQNQDLPE